LSTTALIEPVNASNVEARSRHLEGPRLLYMHRQLVLWNLLKNSIGSYGGNSNTTDAGNLNEGSGLLN